MKLKDLLKKAKQVRAIEKEILVADKELLKKIEELRDIPGSQKELDELKIEKDLLNVVNNNLALWTMPIIINK